MAVITIGLLGVDVGAAGLTGARFSTLGLPGMAVLATLAQHEMQPKPLKTRSSRPHHG
jgi:hypothetical protein